VYAAGVSNADLCAGVLLALRDEFAGYGVDVAWVDVAQRSWVIPVKNLNDYATHFGKGEAL
jgi:hypothetical protein